MTSHPATLHREFSLTLMLTHACNLRCTYCYMGEKRQQVMPRELGCAAIDRALASMTDDGYLELGFFGGEPLLETRLIQTFMDYSLQAAAGKNIRVHFGITTNGTHTQPAAWELMLRNDLDLSISCDGLPATHDRHRIRVDGSGSSDAVIATIRRVVDAGKDLRIIMVVRPDSLADLPANVRFIRSLGVRHIEPSLDLWTTWSIQDEQQLQPIVAQLADIWRDGLPGNSIGWFDEKAAHLAKLAFPPATRCGFGNGAVAVAPTGNLYPCERLIGEDSPQSPIRLQGNAADGGCDFLHLHNTSQRDHISCNSCAMDSMCNTFCRCGNYTRTGDPRRPDRLLCSWNQACLSETARILRELQPR